MKGVILAAGKGTRLYPVTHHVAKPLLPIANRMTMEYAFDRLKEMGIHEICVVVGENEPQMRDSLGDGSAFDVQLSYARQHEPKGLAHAVGFTRAYVGDDSFVLYLGDAVYSRGFVDFIEKFKSTGCANLNLVKAVEDPRRFGVANVHEDKIVKLVEKPQNPESNLAMAGLYAFGPQIWEVLPKLQPSARGEYEITDAIQLLIDDGYDVRAFGYEGDWFDTGTLSSFLDTSGFLTERGNLMGPMASVNGKVGTHVVIGEYAQVDCESLEDAVILPGARVKVNGPIRRALVGGEVMRDSGIESRVVWGDEDTAY